MCGWRRHLHVLTRATARLGFSHVIVAVTTPLTAGGVLLTVSHTHRAAAICGWGVTVRVVVCHSATLHRLCPLQPLTSADGGVACTLLLESPHAFASAMPFAASA